MDKIRKLKKGRVNVFGTLLATMKDATATALYGARGANDVIQRTIINTNVLNVFQS